MKINPKKNEFYMINTSTDYVKEIKKHCENNGRLTQSRTNNYVPIARVDDGSMEWIIIRKYNKNNYLIHFNCIVYVTPIFDIPEDKIGNIEIINIYPDANGKY